MNYFRLLLILAISLSSGMSIAQLAQHETLDTEKSTWTSYLVKEQITVDYKYEECHQSIGYVQQKLLLRITNTSDAVVSVSWHSLLEYNGECKTCDYPNEYGYTVILQPNESMEGDCSLEYKHELCYFSKFVDERYTGFPSQLTDFNMKNLTITTTQK